GLPLQTFTEQLRQMGFTPYHLVLDQLQLLMCCKQPLPQEVLKLAIVVEPLSWIREGRKA
ncbi:hypothetical protein PTW32_15540, partial [Dechloromonas agitata]|uniref:hypothetical protein n=1 Tax=Dechloromonas agitata TaxID=73030 RepID=UPI00237D36F7